MTSKKNQQLQVLLIYLQTSHYHPGDFTKYQLKSKKATIVLRTAELQFCINYNFCPFLSCLLGLSILYVSLFPPSTNCSGGESCLIKANVRFCVFLITFLTALTSKQQQQCERALGYIGVRAAWLDIMTTATIIK